MKSQSEVIADIKALLQKIKDEQWDEQIIKDYKDGLLDNIIFRAIQDVEEQDARHQHNINQLKPSRDIP